MLVGGDNNCKLAHIGKEKLRKFGQLPDTLNLEAIKTSRNKLRDI